MAQSNESAVDKHSRLALQLLEDAAREVSAGDTVQGGEKLWGATSHALKACCASQGLPCGKCAPRRRALLNLADRTGDPYLRSAFGNALSCHGNFYNDWLEQEDLETYLPDVEYLVRQLLEAGVSNCSHDSV